MTRIRNRKPRQMTEALSRSRAISSESSYRIRPIASPPHLIKEYRSGFLEGTILP